MQWIYNANPLVYQNARAPSGRGGIAGGLQQIDMSIVNFCSTSWHLVNFCGNLWQSVAIRGNLWQSMAIRGTCGPARLELRLYGRGTGA